MHAFFSASQIPTPPTDNSVGITSTQTGVDGASPLEAIASLWIHDKERLAKSGNPIVGSEPQIVSPTDVIVSENEHTITSHDYSFHALLSDPTTMTALNASSCTDQTFGLYDDFGFDLDSELARAGYGEGGCSIPASALSFSALSSGCSPIRASFGVGRERRGHELSIRPHYGRYA